MLFKHWLLLFYESIVATLFVYLTFNEFCGIFPNIVKENTTATFAHVFNDVSTNFSV